MFTDQYNSCLKQAQPVHTMFGDLSTVVNRRHYAINIPYWFKWVKKYSGTFNSSSVGAILTLGMRKAA